MLQNLNLELTISSTGLLASLPHNPFWLLVMQRVDELSANLPTSLLPPNVSGITGDKMLTEIVSTRLTTRVAPPDYVFINSS